MREAVQQQEKLRRTDGLARRRDSFQPLGHLLRVVAVVSQNQNQLIGEGERAECLPIADTLPRRLVLGMDEGEHLGASLAETRQTLMRVAVGVVVLDGKLTLIDVFQKRLRLGAGTHQTAQKDQLPVRQMRDDFPQREPLPGRGGGPSRGSSEGMSVRKRSSTSGVPASPVSRYCESSEAAWLCQYPIALRTSSRRAGSVIGGCAAWLHGGIRVFQAMPGQRRDDGDRFGEEALCGQFAQPGDGRGAGRFREQSFQRGEHRVGSQNLRVGHGVDQAAGLVAGGNGAVPAGRIADANGGRHRLRVATGLPETSGAAPAA